MIQPLFQMNTAELRTWLEETIARRSQTLGKTPQRKTVAALAKAWNVPPAELANVVNEFLNKKGSQCPASEDK